MTAVVTRQDVARSARLRMLSWNRQQSPPSSRRRRNADELIRGSFFLAVTTGATGALGFAFWLINAQLYTPAQIGEATSLISATVMISYFSLFGLNSTLIRYLPSSTRRNEEVTVALLVVLVVATLLCTGYILLLPVTAPRLQDVVGNLADATLFTVLTALSAVNLCTDSVFIALRRAKYNLYINGFLQGAVKLLLPFFLIGLGGFGIFVGSGIAATFAVTASVLMMYRRLGLRLRLTAAGSVVRRLVRFSAANYVASLFNLIPILVLPMIILNVRGSAETGYFYISFQIANLLNGGAYAVSESLFAEGSYSGAALGRLAKRSAVVLGLLMVPASLILAGVAGLLLSLFGDDYVSQAAGCLSVFALGGIAVTLNSWTGSLLRITDRLWTLMWSNVVYAGSIVGLAILWADRGLTWIALAWLIGNLLSGGCAGLALLPWSPSRRRNAVPAGTDPQTADPQTMELRRPDLRSTAPGMAAHMSALEWTLPLAWHDVTIPLGRPDALPVAPPSVSNSGSTTTGKNPSILSDVDSLRTRRENGSDGTRLKPKAGERVGRHRAD